MPTAAARRQMGSEAYCSANRTCCPDGTCADLTTDVNNCGVCGTPCPASMRCVHARRAALPRTKCWRDPLLRQWVPVLLWQRVLLAGSGLLRWPVLSGGPVLQQQRLLVLGWTSALPRRCLLPAGSILCRHRRASPCNTTQLSANVSDTRVIGSRKVVWHLPLHLRHVVGSRPRAGFL